MELLNKANIKSVLNQSGVYLIKISDKYYVGSSNNIGLRLRTHLSTLKNKTHHNQTMQNCWNKYGDASFSILEITNDCVGRERHYIEVLEPYMNHILDPVTLVRDETYRKRISESMKKHYENNDVWNKKEVHMYSLNGKYIRSFTSGTEAAEFIGNGDPSGIFQCCNGKAYTAWKHKWSLTKVDKLVARKKNYKTRSIIKYSLNGVELERYSSLKETEVSNVRRAIRDNLTAGGYKWSYE